MSVISAGYGVRGASEPENRRLIGEDVLLCCDIQNMQISGVLPPLFHRYILLGAIFDGLCLASFCFIICSDKMLVFVMVMLGRLSGLEPQQKTLSQK